MLMIRDGWGINPGGREKREENGDAALLARTPFHDRLYRDYPGGKLSADLLTESCTGLPSTDRLSPFASSADFVEITRERIGNLLRATAGNGPANGMSRDAKNQRKCKRDRRLQRKK